MLINSSPPEQDGRNFADDISEHIFLKEKVSLHILVQHKDEIFSYMNVKITVNILFSRICLIPNNIDGRIYNAMPY